MRILAEIELKKYLLWCMFPTGICLFLARSMAEIAGILIVFFATVINHFLLVEGVSGIIGDAVQKPRKKVGKYVVLFLFKFFVLFVGLVLGYLLMEKRVVIPLLNYFFLILVLVFSLKGNVDKNG